MKLDNLKKRLSALEIPGQEDCPFCNCIKNLDEWPDERLRELIDFLDAKCSEICTVLEKFLSAIPESNPACSRCRRALSEGREQDHDDQSNSYLVLGF
jgi:hypothetical protein